MVRPPILHRFAVSRRGISVICRSFGLVDSHNPPFVVRSTPSARLPPDDPLSLQVLGALLEGSRLGPSFHRFAHRCASSCHELVDLRARPHRAGRSRQGGPSPAGRWRRVGRRSRRRRTRRGRRRTGTSMKPSASTGGVGAADIARERRNACSAARMSSERVSNSPFATNESTSWSSLRLHRRAIRASSVPPRRSSASCDDADFRPGALSNTATHRHANY